MFFTAIWVIGSFLVILASALYAGFIDAKLDRIYSNFIPKTLAVAIFWPIILSIAILLAILLAILYIPYKLGALIASRLKRK